MKKKSNSIAYFISVSASKSVHLSFTLSKRNCPSVAIYCSIIAERNHIMYLGIHHDRRLIWVHDIASKITQLKLKTSDRSWLIDPQSKLVLELKVLLYKAMLIWICSIKMW